MKRFFRTVTGKTIAFIAHILLTAVLVGSMLCAVLFIENGIYTQDRKDVQRVLFYSRANDVAETVLLDCLYYSPETPGKVVSYYSSDGNVTGYELVGPDGKTVASSGAPYGDSDMYSYRIYFEKRNDGSADWWYLPGTGDLDEGNAAHAYTVNIYISTDLQSGDMYSTIHRMIGLAYYVRYGIIALAVVSLIGSVVFFLTMMSSSARIPDSDEIHPGPLNRIPIDILIALGAAASMLMVACVDEIGALRWSIRYGAMAVCALLILCMTDGICISIASRIKQKNLINGSLIYKVLRLVWRMVRGCAGLIVKLLRSIPIIWKTTLFAFVHMVLLVWILATNNEGLFVLLEAAVSIVLIYFAYTMRQLQIGARRLASGDLDYKINTNEMILDFKEHGDNLNMIGVGMDNAVREQMRSERLKTELITNVSHDIKTPLTSIINYVDLINKEDCDNDKINEYVEVLDRQSKRLKKLIEDLIEVSKASTGNLDVELVPCDLGVALVQAVSEYKDRFDNAGLEMIITKQEEPVMVMADGRRMWRVFDNLLSNICKYALKGTRVYIDLQGEGDDAVVSFRNISSAALKVKPVDLEDRFVRGDSSRNTDGNGLGLSISKSLVELQGGTQNIYVDGDLFKVVLRFPRLREYLSAEDPRENGSI